MYDHRFLENIKKLYKYAGKYDDQQHYKSILGSEMVSNLEGLTDNSKMSPGIYRVRVRKSLVQENHSANFLKFWTENQKLLSSSYVMQIKAQIYQSRYYFVLQYYK